MYSKGKCRQIKRQDEDGEEEDADDSPAPSLKAGGDSSASQEALSTGAEGESDRSKRKVDCSEAVQCKQRAKAAMGIPPKREVTPSLPKKTT